MGVAIVRIGRSHRLRISTQSVSPVEAVTMNATDLRELQAPLKAKYKDDPAAAQYTIRAVGRVDGASLDCRVATPRGEDIVAGLHPATGGDGSAACSADMLLESLVACAGVTLRAVATALEIPIRTATVSAEGDLDFRGTLGVDRQTPIGFSAIRLRYEVDADATDEQLATLLKLAERYCVIFQTLKSPPQLSATCERA
jgi:uncharacterized OsmC-like protein